MTPNSIRSTLNYENFELIGDTILKVMVSIYGIIKLTDEGEGELTVIKSKMASNYNLARLCI
ncbi:MAG: hypothetical protein DHS20C13_28440 [Thermodesulfobacteriota bacterium]|nr:MAG: hypothetical protein DHS20C13_28440 [Thermodesulfobacteriota bacterium]